MGPGVMLQIISTGLILRSTPLHPVAIDGCQTDLALFDVRLKLRAPKGR